jgi:deoxyribodipyrimidine photo-lyase
LLRKMPPPPRVGNVTGLVSAFLPATRSEALARLEAFLPLAPAYGATRNHVVTGHENVSRLSPATRTRVLLEREILAAARARHEPATIEKFEQEVWWRLYWKGWLEQRPAIWTAYRQSLDHLEWSDRAREVIAGESGIAILDHFTRELIETGYLHNHARMWWASWWIHGEGLPWELGAHFFLQHLRDGDAASNTLSWRWVAGLHTRGKAYLVRRSNLERYVAPETLGSNGAGLERLESVEIRPLPWQDPPPPLRLAAADPDPGPRTGIWIHDEDLSVERSPLSGLSPVALLATAPTGLWEREGYSPDKRTFLRAALADGAERAAGHFGLYCPVRDTPGLGEALANWAAEERLDTVIALAPFTGPLSDELPGIESALADRGVRLNLVRRPEDVAVMNRATGGFFGFWERVRGT